MATKGYPGLVVVPPSDRTILRRRLVDWAFIIIALVWSASASKVWVPTSDDNGNCQVDVGQVASANFSDGCIQSGRSVTEGPSRLSAFSVAEASQGGSLARSHGSVPPLYTARLVTQHYTYRPWTTNPNPSARSSNRTMPTPNWNEPQLDSTGRKAVPTPSLDARLAEQGNPFALYRLARFYAQLSGPKAPESIIWYVRAYDGLIRLAEAGNGQAMYVLGIMYTYGRGVTKDEEQARRWLAQAIDQQVPAAHAVLARLDGHQNADTK